MAVVVLESDVDSTLNSLLGVIAGVVLMGSMVMECRRRKVKKDSAVDKLDDSLMDDTQLAARLCDNEVVLGKKADSQRTKNKSVRRQVKPEGQMKHKSKEDISQSSAANTSKRKGGSKENTSSVEKTGSKISSKESSKDSSKNSQEKKSKESVGSGESPAMSSPDKIAMEVKQRLNERKLAEVKRKMEEEKKLIDKIKKEVEKTLEDRRPVVDKVKVDNSKENLNKPPKIHKAKQSAMDTVKKNVDKSEDEAPKTVIGKVAAAVGNIFRRKKDTQEEGDQNAKDEYFDLNKVKKLGNLDEMRHQKKAVIEAEIASMHSEHEWERGGTTNAVTNGESSAAQRSKHITISLDKSQLYETNDEPTLDEENDAMELMMLKDDE